jgi:hypothetical protein
MVIKLHGLQDICMLLLKAHLSKPRHILPSPDLTHSMLRAPDLLSAPLLAGPNEKGTELTIQHFVAPQNKCDVFLSLPSRCLFWRRTALQDKTMPAACCFLKGALLWVNKDANLPLAQYSHRQQSVVEHDPGRDLPNETSRICRDGHRLHETTATMLVID